jgi:hypothetical protein
MPIQFNLEDLRKEYGCKTYLETGLYDPRVDVSCKKALLCDFEKIYTIEIRKDWVDLAHTVFAKDIESGRLSVINDDSINLSNHISNNPNFNVERAVFFLDAHVDNGNIKNYTMMCPLDKELLSIKSLQRNDHIILVDDVRILITKFPWGEKSKGDIDFLQMVKNLILDINPEYRFKFLDGFVEKDVLCAYI